MRGPLGTLGRATRGALGLTRGAIGRLGMADGRLMEGRATLLRPMLGRPTADRLMFPPKDGRDMEGPRIAPIEGRPPPPPPPLGPPPRGAASRTEAANTRKATANARCLFMVPVAVSNAPLCYSLFRAFSPVFRPADGTFR